MAMDLDQLKTYYREKFDGQIYLEKYFGKFVMWFDKLFLQKMNDFFHNVSKRGGRCIEIGCGPTIHRSSSSSLHCESLVFCDISENCLDFLKTWKESKSYEKLFQPGLRYVAQLENLQDSEESAKVIEDRIRNKVSDIVACDLLSNEPFGEQKVGLFDVVISCGCLEGAALTKDQFDQALENVISVLKPGGALILGGYHGSTYYYVGDDKLPNLRMTIEDIEESLKKAGLLVEECQEYKAEDYRRKPTNKNIGTDCDKTFLTISTKPF